MFIIALARTKWLDCVDLVARKLGEAMNVLCRDVRHSTGKTSSKESKGGRRNCLDANARSIYEQLSTRCPNTSVRRHRSFPLPSPFQEELLLNFCQSRIHASSIHTPPECVFFCDLHPGSLGESFHTRDYCVFGAPRTSQYMTQRKAKEMLNCFLIQRHGFRDALT